ncbi:unnamed protein product, partial [Ectocarpus sp. 12 AP-2014]
MQYDVNTTNHAVPHEDSKQTTCGCEYKVAGVRVVRTAVPHARRLKNLPTARRLVESSLLRPDPDAIVFSSPPYNPLRRWKLKKHRCRLFSTFPSPRVATV